jgi:hypothetical protein
MSEWNEISVSSAAPQKEKVEFEIEQDEVLENEPVAETKPNRPIEKVEAETDTEEDTDGTNSNEAEMLKGVETKGAQKRIRQLVQQRKEREERIAALEVEKEELRKKLREQEKDLSTSLKRSIDSSEEKLLSKIDYAKQAYERAADEGNSKGMLEAQEAMTQAYAELTGVKSSRESWQRYNEQVEAQFVEQPQPQQQQAQYDPKAVVWAGKNDWFGSNNVMTAAALAIDYDLKNEGYSPSDDEFYEEIDRRMHEQFPHKFQAEVEEQPVARRPNASNSAQVVAGASRTPASPSSGKKVKLTQEDIRLANKWGIPLERYAEEKLKAERASGDYTTIG